MGKKKGNKAKQTPKKQSSEEYDPGKEYAYSMDSDDKIPPEDYESPESAEIEAILGPIDENNITADANAPNHSSDEEAQPVKKNKKKKNKKKKNKNKKEEPSEEVLDELLAISGDEGRDVRLTEAMRRVKVQSAILQKEKKKFDALRRKHNIPAFTSDEDEPGGSKNVPPPSYEQEAMQYASPTSSVLSDEEQEETTGLAYSPSSPSYSSSSNAEYSPPVSPPPGFGVIREGDVPVLYSPSGLAMPEMYSPEPDIYPDDEGNSYMHYTSGPPGNYRIILSARRRYDTGSPDPSRTPESTQPRLIRREERGGTVVNREVSGWHLEERENGLYVARQGTTRREISRYHLMGPSNIDHVFPRAENTTNYSLPVLRHRQENRDPSPTGTYATRIIKEARNLPLPPGFGRQEYEPYVNKGQPPPGFLKEFHGSDVIMKTSDEVELHCHSEILKFMCPNPPPIKNGILDLPYNSRGMIRALQLMYGVEERYYDPFNLDEYIDMSDFYAKYLCKSVYNHVYSRIQTWPFDQQVKYYVATVHILPIHNIYLTWMVSYRPRATFLAINDYFNKLETPVKDRYKFPEQILKALQIKVPKLPNDPIDDDDDE